MSYQPHSCVFCEDMIKSKNYVDKNGNRPPVNTFIGWNSISFDVKNIKKNKWTFINKDLDIISRAKKQWEDLRFFDDDIFILE